MSSSSCTSWVNSASAFDGSARVSLPKVELNANMRGRTSTATPEDLGDPNSKSMTPRSFYSISRKSPGSVHQFAATEVQHAALIQGLAHHYFQSVPVYRHRQLYTTPPDETGTMRTSEIDIATIPRDNCLTDRHRPRAKYANFRP
ncbi:hypothetical protein PUN28_016450 [Cardiocondyla obscurior]|uniref:Uncharacterized protein n=1 Tax=Cardiocondyla obscurior TaxID=286306 RepID=A0AAW2ER05_9HYME